MKLQFKSLSLSFADVANPLDPPLGLVNKHPQLLITSVVAIINYDLLSVIVIQHCSFILLIIAF